MSLSYIRRGLTQAATLGWGGGRTSSVLTVCGSETLGVPCMSEMVVATEKTWPQDNICTCETAG